MRTTVTIDLDQYGARVRVETDNDDNDPPPGEQHDSDLGSVVESIGNRIANPIGFHANLEPEDGRYDQ